MPYGERAEGGCKGQRRKAAAATKQGRVGSQGCPWHDSYLKVAQVNSLPFPGNVAVWREKHVYHWTCHASRLALTRAAEVVQG